MIQKTGNSFIHELFFLSIICHVRSLNEQVQRGQYSLKKTSSRRKKESTTGSTELFSRAEDTHGDGDVVESMC